MILGVVMYQGIKKSKMLKKSLIKNFIFCAVLCARKRSVDLSGVVFSKAINV